MRLTITSEHRDFFKKNHFLMFEEALSNSQLETLQHALKETVAHRLTDNMLASKGDTSFITGFDMWRDSVIVRKMTQKLAFLSLASEVFQQKYLRVAFDHYFALSNPITPPFCEEGTLQENSCFHPIAGTMIIPIEDPLYASPQFPLPTAGGILFLSPQAHLSWSSIFSAAPLSFLVIVFAEHKTLFRAGSSDPHAPLFKKLGYVFGDILDGARHPIVFSTHC